MFKTSDRALATDSIDESEEKICGNLAHTCENGCEMLFEDVLDNYYFGANYCSRQNVTFTAEFDRKYNSTTVVEKSNETKWLDEG